LAWFWRLGGPGLWATAAACGGLAALALLAATAQAAQAGEQAPTARAAAPAAWATPGSAPVVAATVPAVPVPRVAGRLRAADLGLVINTADPYSVVVGAHYRRARGLADDQVLALELPVRATLTPAEFEVLRQRIAEHFGPAVQALALAWAQPYAVACNSLTGALALGFDAALCANSCGVSRPSPLFNASTLRPWTDLGLRPSMLLAAPDAPAAMALIDRGVAADGALTRRGRPPVVAALLTTADRARNVRERLYPPAGLLQQPGVDMDVRPADDLPALRHLLLVHTGSVRVALEPPPHWAPGGLGDHLTSFGGALQGAHGHTTVLDWVAAGATASHGSVSEPCNHLQKFPHPQVLLGHYLQGASALEAYWKSVAWPQQSLFVGEPLSAPFAPPVRPSAPWRRSPAGGS
jgi:uncharacterized protein (TIGR03790 family)